MSAAASLEDALRALRGQEGERGVALGVRTFIEQARAHLRDLHTSSESGRVVNETNSDLIDRLVRRLYGLAEERFVTEGGEIGGEVCAVAVGGYARREMSVHSDVDLLVLYRGEITPYVASIAERLQYWLWDAGLSVGCATRTVSETVSLGLRDVTVRTGILTARFLCGDGEFFHDFADSIRRELLPDVDTFIAEQQRALRSRHYRYGESLFLLQPNIKEGAGALRDYHSAYWVARAAQTSARGLDDFLHFGLLTESELELVKVLGPLMGKSPRAVKKFINLYRILRGLRRGGDLTRFLGPCSSEEPNYAAVQFWLAADCGLSSEQFERLSMTVAQTVAQEEKGSISEMFAFIEPLTGSTGGRKNSERDRLAKLRPEMAGFWQATSQSEQQGLIDAFGAMHEALPPPHGVAALKAAIRETRRFSASF